MAQESAKIAPRWPSWSQDGAIMAPRWPKMRQHGPNSSLKWPKRGPRWPSWSQDGAHMAPRWPKMRQHGPRRAPRSAQDGQRQHGPKMIKMCQHGPTHAPILKNLRFPYVFHDFRSPEGAQDGPGESQDRAKMAKLEPRWSQHGPKMAKDEPTWADIGTQHGLRLRITAPVQQIRPSKRGGFRFALQTVSSGAGEGIYI